MPRLAFAMIVVGVWATGCSTQSPVAPDPAIAPTGLAAPPGSSTGSAVSANAADRGTVPVRVAGGGPVIPGSSSMLVRNDGGITVTLHTSGLTPGNAYTMWFVVFNNPGACVGGCGADDLGRVGVDSSVVFATGHVVGAGNADNFAGWLGIGDTGGAISGPGLLNPRGAEIHAVVRNHGAAIADLVHEQISSFNGGCPPNSCANVQVAMHVP